MESSGLRGEWPEGDLRETLCLFDSDRRILRRVDAVQPGAPGESSPHHAPTGLWMTGGFGNPATGERSPEGVWSGHWSVA